MKCPRCDREVKIADVVFLNAEAYRNTNLATSECCGKAFIVRPVMTYDIVEYTGTKTEDDWGNSITK